VKKILVTSAVEKARYNKIVIVDNAEIIQNLLLSMLILDKLLSMWYVI